MTNNNMAKYKGKFSKLVTTMSLLYCLGSQANTNDFYLSLDNDNLNISPTFQENKYTILTKTDLRDTNDWTEVNSLHGNGSNLVVKVDTSQTAGFFKVKSKYEPVAPLETQVGYSHNPHQKYPSYGTLKVFNYTTNNLQGSFTYTETDNVYGLQYTNIFPCVKTLVPGENLIDTSAYWVDYSGTGGTVYGQVNLEVLSQ